MANASPTSRSLCASQVSQKRLLGWKNEAAPNAQGVTSYKGMARNSNAAEGLWFASPRDTSLDKATDVYWFESAFDAMAYYQLTKEHIKESIQRLRADAE